MQGWRGERVTLPYLWIPACQAVAEQFLRQRGAYPERNTESEGFAKTDLSMEFIPD